MPSFDIVGDIAIVEDKKLLKEVLETHKHVKAVLLKDSSREGEFRNRKFRLLYGKRTETVHIEHGCRYFLDVTKAYFSTRESTERQRVAGLVKPGERVCILFGGIGPYAIQIAKRVPTAIAYTVEVNPDASKYAEKSIGMNKLSGRVVPVCTDVAKLGPEWDGQFDRVAMPLPKEGHKFLGKALGLLKKGGVVHFYFVAPRKDLFSAAEGLLETEAKKLGRKVKVLGKKKVLAYAPGIWKACIDAQVNS